MEEKKIKSVCFTGHRRLNISPEIHTLLISQLKKLISEGCCDFYAGGALGWDTVCERAVIELKRNGFDIRLHLVLPCCFEEQTKGWPEDDKEEFVDIQSCK